MNKPQNGFLAFLFDVFGHLFKRFSKLFGRIIFDGKGSVIVSFLMAVFICVAIDYDTISIRLFNDTSTTVTISDVVVNALYDEDIYEVTGVPSTVDLTITGQTADIQVYRQQGTMSVTADLRKYSEGQNIIDLSVDGLPQSLTAKINPNSITVQIDKKYTKRFTVTPELLVGNGQKVTDFQTPILETTMVEITGSHAKLESIRVVKALIDTTGQIQDFNANATIVAYDANGRVLDVEIEPATVEATVQLSTNTSTVEPKEGE